MIKPIKKGFTLIEMLVVVAIIGVLASIIVPNFLSSQARARDAQRKSDLTQIGRALELYYQDYGTYPNGSGGNIVKCGLLGTTACTWGAIDVNGKFNDTKTTYFRQLPKDPRGYTYYYRVFDGNKKYQLYARLENEDDASCIGGNCVSPPALPVGDTACVSKCNFAVTSPNTTALDAS